jgi:hypothetical protein
MKNRSWLVILCLCGSAVKAQKIVEKHIPFTAGKSVVMDLQIADSIRVITWNKNEVYAKASINIDSNKYNEYYTTSFDETGSNINIKAKLDFPKTKRECNCNCETVIYWDVFIPENAGFSVESINGNITILGNPAEIRAHSISGFIDLTIPATRKADFKFSTITGTVYTNLAINTSKDGQSSNSFNDRYNGGGKKIDLETISGDIFLRKSE